MNILIVAGILLLATILGGYIMKDNQKIRKDHDDTDSATGKLINEPNEYTGPVITNPIKAIRAKCLDCSGGNPNEVRICWITDCALFPFRTGRNPYRKSTPRRELSEEQKEAGRINLAKARKAWKTNNGSN